MATVVADVSGGFRVSVTLLLYQPWVAKSRSLMECGGKPEACASAWIKSGRDAALDYPIHRHEFQSLGHSIQSGVAFRPACAGRNLPPHSISPGWTCQAWRVKTWRVMFRPCIDLHEGKVKQIVGGTLSGPAGALRTNFVSDRPSAWYAALYQRDQLKGGHIIMLGPGNEAAALSALAAYPSGMQVGGGVTQDNAPVYLDAGASHVIVTSWVFREGRIDWDRLQALSKHIGKERLVVDLSCRKRDGKYVVVTDRWRTFTETELSPESLRQLSVYCDEFLVHAVDVEGLCRGIDAELVQHLAAWTPLPTTYAGGAKSIGDLEEVTRVSGGRIDLTIGSALDIFGGSGVRYEDVVAFNRRQGRAAAP